MNAFQSDSETSHGGECRCTGADGVCNCKVKCKACAERLRLQEPGMMSQEITDAYIAEAALTPRTSEFIQGD